MKVVIKILAQKKKVKVDRPNREGFGGWVSECGVCEPGKLPDRHSRTAKCREVGEGTSAPNGREGLQEALLESLDARGKRPIEGQVARGLEGPGTPSGMRASGLEMLGSFGAWDTGSQVCCGFSLLSCFLSQVLRYHRHLDSDQHDWSDNFRNFQ